jgi:HAD superfamily hydrolase (TIGR01549 family)
MRDSGQRRDSGLDGPLRAIVWDFDGTLVDTSAKNLMVNRRIVEELTGTPWDRFPVLGSQDAYNGAQRRSANWREFYGHGIELSEEQIDRAGAMWTELQLADTTPAPFFDGIDAALAQLDGIAKQGIVSQNSRQNIESMLQAAGLRDHFELIVGYEEVDLRRQKPEPDGLLSCIERLSDFAGGLVLSIGDHETDVRCSRNANLVLAERGGDLCVVSVGASFDGLGGDARWELRPDFCVSSPEEVVALAMRWR